MDLWIRSQDKMKLIRVIDLGIFEEQEGYTIFYDDSIDNMLGTYETKERALEVLDEIENILKPKIKYTKGKINGSFNGVVIRNEDTTEIKEFSTFVYEMPEK